MGTILGQLGNTVLSNELATHRDAVVAQARVVQQDCGITINNNVVINPPPDFATHTAPADVPGAGKSYGGRTYGG